MAKMNVRCLRGVRRGRFAAPETRRLTAASRSAASATVGVRRFRGVRRDANENRARWVPSCDKRQGRVRLAVRRSRLGGYGLGAKNVRGCGGAAEEVVWTGRPPRRSRLGEDGLGGESVQ